MRAPRSKLRAVALVAVATLALHQLRYLIAGGGEASQSTGHEYLPFAGLAAGLLLAFAGGQLMAAVARARRTGELEARPPSYARTWAVAAAVLLSIHGAQEVLEVLLATGRVDAAVLTEGAPWAVPLALALGALVTLFLLGARAAVAVAARRAEASALPRALPRTRRPYRRRASRPASVLGRHLAGRAPPLAS